MQYKTIITTCVALAAFVGVAKADIHYDMAGLQASCDKASKQLSTTLGIGYDTKFVSRGLAFRDADTDNVIPVEITAAYKLNDHYTLLGGLKYQWLTANHLTHNDHSGFCDEGTGILGIARTFGTTTFAASYQFVHGGVAGSLNGHMKGDHNHNFPAFDHNRPEEHSFVLDVHHEFTGNGMKNFFWDSRIQYAFRWQEGWWFANTLGYKHEINEKTDIVAAATWNATIGYFDRYTEQANGTQGLSLTVKVPYRPDDKVTVTPFVGLHWLGNGGQTANKYGNGQVYRNFTFNVGVGVSYSF